MELAYKADDISLIFSMLYANDIWLLKRYSVQMNGKIGSSVNMFIKDTVYKKKAKFLRVLRVNRNRNRQ